MSLSMKDADQETGEDLNPSANNRGARNREDDLQLVNPERPTGKHNLADIIGRTQVRKSGLTSLSVGFINYSRHFDFAFGT